MADIQLYQRTELPPQMYQTAKPSYAMASQQGVEEFGGAVAHLSGNILDRLIQARTDNEIHEFQGFINTAQQNFRGKIQANPGMSFDDMNVLKQKMESEITAASGKLTLPASKRYGTNWMNSNRASLMAAADNDIAGIVSKHEADRLGMTLDNILNSGDPATLDKYNAAIDSGVKTGLIHEGMAEPLKEQGRLKMQRFIRAGQVNSVMGLARETFNAEMDNPDIPENKRVSLALEKSKSLIEKSDIAEEDKVQAAKDLDYWASARQAEKLQAKNEAEEADLKEIVKFYSSKKIEDLEAGYEFTKNSSLEPDKKQSKLDDFTRRIDYLKKEPAAGKDASELYDPVTYIDFSRRAMNKTISQSELDMALGKGEKKGISVSQYNQLSALIKRDPVKIALHKRYQSVLTDLSRRYAFSTTPEYNKVLHAQAASLLDEWAAANPEAEDVDYKTKIDEITSIIENPVGWKDITEKKSVEEGFNRMRDSILDESINEIRIYYPRLSEQKRAQLDGIIASKDKEKINQALTILNNYYGR